MDYDGNGTLYHLNCGICGRTFWSHDAFANVCEECKGTDVNTDKERIIAFLQKLIPDNFECGHIAVTFNDDGSLFITVSNREDE